MELKVTKERVLAAAKKCSQATGILKELFPEVFVDDLLAGYHLKRVKSPGSLKGIIVTGKVASLIMAHGFTTGTFSIEHYPVVVIFENGNYNGFPSISCLLSSGYTIIDRF